MATPFLRVRVLVLFLVMLLLSVPLFAGKKVRTLSATATHDCCAVFVTSVLRPSKRIVVSQKTKIVTQGTAVFTEKEERTATPQVREGDHFVGITLVYSGTPEVRKIPVDQWKGSRPSGFAEDAALVFSDGTVIPAQLGSGDDGLPATSKAEWAPGIIMTDAKTLDVVYRNYIFQPKDEYLGVETIYFPIVREQWKKVKPVSLRINDTEIPFDVKKWPN